MNRFVCVQSCVDLEMLPTFNFSMPEFDFNEIVALICKEDGRFDPRAYNFVRAGLDHSVKALKTKHESRATSGSFHVTGRELSEGLRDYALEQFGPMAPTVLGAWGLTQTADFGEIVYNLIEYNVFSKTEADRREDFAGVYDFNDAFVKPFLPSKPRRSLDGPSSQALGAA